MAALVKRNIKLYLQNRVGVLMSLLGALISFFIYIGFLQKNMATSWGTLPHVHQALDAWVIGGILAITGITTAFAVSGQLVSDREKNIDWDLRMTALTPTRITIAYLASTAIVSFFMQVIMLIVMSGYFYWQDRLVINLSANFPQLFLITLLNTLFATSCCQLIVAFIRQHTVYSRVAALVGTLTGFLVATYMPLGVLSHGMQRLVKLFPGSYIAAAYRQVLMKDFANNDFPRAIRQQLIDFLGIRLTIHQHLLNLNDELTLVIAGIMVSLILLIAIDHLKYRQN